MNFFCRYSICLVKFSYWSKFHGNMISGSGVLTISFNKGLTRNTEIGNTPSEFCPIPEDWASKEFGTNVSNKIFLNAAKIPGLQLYCF